MDSCFRLDFINLYLLNLYSFFIHLLINSNLNFFISIIISSILISKSSLKETHIPALLIYTYEISTMHQKCLFYIIIYLSMFLFFIVYILAICIFIFLDLFSFIKSAIKIYLHCIIFKTQSKFNNNILLYELFHQQLKVIICIIIIFFILFYLIDFYFR